MKDHSYCLNTIEISDEEETETLETESAENTLKIRAEWNEKTTKQLIDLYKNNCSSIGKNKSFHSYNNLWVFISQQMSDSNYTFTPMQIKQKWDCLSRAYKDRLKENSPTGRKRKHFPYQRELNEIFDNNSNVHLEYLADATEQWNCENNSNCSVSEDETVQIPDCNTTKSIPTTNEANSQKKKNKKSPLTLLRESLNEQHKERMRVLENYQKKRIKLKKYYEDKKHEDRLLLIEAIKNFNKT